MFSLQSCDDDELDLATSQGYQIPHDLIVDHSLLMENNLISFNFSATTTTTTTTPCFQSPPHRRAAVDQSRLGGSIVRRDMHREIERKRRQEMSSLCASLRSLLPQQHNKGKSSVSDQMDEAANYIKQMHKKIEESRSHRDNLKKKLYNSSSSRENDESFEGGGDNCVAIHKVMDGLEILINTRSREPELSRLLSELVETQLDVVSCVSTRTKGGFLHKLEVQAMDMSNLDLSVLHNRLIGIIN